MPPFAARTDGVAPLTSSCTFFAFVPSGKRTKTFCGGVGRNSRSGPFIIIGLVRLTKWTVRDDACLHMVTSSTPGPVTVTGGASLAFDDEGHASGTGGVNRFAGTYVVDDGVLTLGPLATTRMMGPPELMVEEQAVLQVLSSPLTVVDAPVLEPAGPDEAEQRLEDEGGPALEEIVTLEASGLTVRLTPDRGPIQTV